MRRACFNISGRVQGVGFRYAAAKQAMALGLLGWVSNLDDGSVIIAFEGSESNVATMTDWLAQGPPLARVDAIHALPVDDTPFSARFEIR